MLGVKTKPKVDPQRIADQALLKSRPSLIEERTRLLAERATIAGKVSDGQLTERGFDKIDRRLAELARQINDCDNGCKTRLHNSCPSDEHRRQYAKMSKELKGGIGAILAGIDANAQTASESLRILVNERNDWQARGIVGADLKREGERDANIVELQRQVDEYAAERQKTVEEQQRGLRELAELAATMRAM